MKRRHLIGLSITPFLERLEAMNTGTRTDDLVEHVSKTDFPTTLGRVVETIEKAGMTVFATIDHAKAAQSVGLTMPPTVVLLFGNPRGGTPVMLAAPQAALELPLRALLRQGSDGKAILSFHPIAGILRQAGVAQEMAARLQASQELLASALHG